MIPRVLHQLWIGPAPRPQQLLDTWAAWHGEAQGFRYVLWDEARLREEGMEEAARRRGVLAAIDAIGSWNGKADVWRWLILAELGGAFSDADARCTRCCGELLGPAQQQQKQQEPSFVAAFENEAVRGPGCFPALADVPQDVPLVATGFMACTPDHPLVLNALDEIAAQPCAALRVRAAWRSVGPALLTRALRRLVGPEALLGQRSHTPAWLRLLPSYTFYPTHATGLSYRGHGRVFARQLWGSTPDAVSEAEAEAEAAAPTISDVGLRAVSVLVCSRDARADHLRACLDSILHQQGDFAIELVWVDDRSGPVHAAVLGRMLDDLEARSQGIVVRRTRIGPAGGDEELPTKAGVAEALQAGLALCSHPLVARMDADDIMTLDRLERQIAFMAEHPDLVCVGAQAMLFRDGEDAPHGQTQHAAHIRAEELAAYGSKTLPRWLANHPTLVFRREAVLAAGGYRSEFEGAEDYDLLLRLLLAHGHIRNMPQPLLYYRQSPTQVTASNKAARAALQDELAEAFVRQARKPDRPDGLQT